MNEHALKLATYWRNSLADAEHGKGGLKADDLNRFTALPLDALQAGVLPAGIAAALFQGEPASVFWVDATLRPRAYQAMLEHGKLRSGQHAVVTPLLTQMKVNRHGQMMPGQSLVPRDILEPLDDGAFAIGEVGELDRFLSVSPVQPAEVVDDAQPIEAHAHQHLWTAYLDYTRDLLAQVTNNVLDGQPGLALMDDGYLFKEQAISGASQHIVRLYDHLRDTAPCAPLFDHFSALDVQADEPCLPTSSGFAARLGHASDQYALAPEQRDALTHCLAGRDGDILAVNGPPGTGKTTLLLSVVASLWAKAALAGGEPPVILASSTNNQAVTNVIDAFGSEFASGHGAFAGRWLPRIDSFGAYFPRKDAEAAAAQSYQTRSFFTQVESLAYVQEAEAAWLAKAREAFAAPHLTVADAVARLQQAIGLYEHELQQIEHAWHALEAARLQLKAGWGDDPDAAVAEQQAQAAALQVQLEQHRQQRAAFNHYLAAESVWYALFAWVPAVATKRLLRAKVHLAQTLEDDGQLDALDSVAALSQWLDSRCNAAAQAHAESSRRVAAAQALLAARDNALRQWHAALAPLCLPAETLTATLTLADCDPLADTRVRFAVFLLTTHYWEGRWLLEVAHTLPEILESQNKNGRKTLEKRWRRWMKLTPCVVSTFYMLPKHLKAGKHDGTGFVDDYLCNFADLLIVDEAGQALPEVAGASFALARQALVIGDTLQIEPIWSIPAAVDIGNLMSAGLLARTGVAEGYEHITASGLSAASGSVMRIAQKASRYHYDTDMARGMFLYEHRRCYDAIVAYCNELCYQGKLVPRRGAKPEGGLPALGYLHVDGKCEQQNGRSRINQLEADTIAAWLVEHREELQVRYGKPLTEIVGIITPFGAQAQAIVEACNGRDIAAGKGDGVVTVGTVHAFQGAARPVVIFSAVYSKHADGGFIDNRQSMLNVAVSRAKDSFLVFADMDLFGLVPAGKPRGLLAHYLLGDPGNELPFAAQPRQDLPAPAGVSHLNNASAHDQFLLRTLASATREVHIVSPWLILQRIHEIGAWEAMSAAVGRGVKVRVYTDRQFNLGSHKDEDYHQREADLHQALHTLRGQQIESHVLNRVHSKLVMADDALLCVGSFNWFSARRDGWANYETSMVYSGDAVADEIGTQRSNLAARISRRH